LYKVYYLTKDYIEKNRIYMYMRTHARTHTRAHTHTHTHTHSILSKILLYYTIAISEYFH